MRLTDDRLALAVALGTALLLLFGIGALGVIGSGGRPDLMYVAVLAAGVVGAGVARFRPRGMAVSLAGTALATLVVGVGAVLAGLHRDEGGSALDVIALSVMYAGLFGLSAWLYWRAAHDASSLAVRRRN